MKKGLIIGLVAFAEAVVVAGVVEKVSLDKKRKIQAMSDKHLDLFFMMNQWVKVKQEGKSLVSFFQKHGYKKIAIYGMSYAGKTLIDELKDSIVTVAYAIDKNAYAIYSDVNVVTMEESLEEVDAVVVTAITFFAEIQQDLWGKVDCPVISLEDILYEV